MIEKFGGPGRVRTDDLFHAMEARSQLRHRPSRVGAAIARDLFILNERGGKVKSPPVGNSVCRILLAP